MEGAKNSPVILVNGARQSGKSTLMQGLFASKEQPIYVTLDNLTSLSAAKKSPQSFLQGLPGCAVIDEIQRAPGLFLPIKEVVDREKKAGRFFLTGSANVLSLPKLSESLAGRMEIHTLWPVSQGEIRGVKEDFIDALFGTDKFSSIKPVGISELLEIITTGGYPNVLKRENRSSRTLWFESHLTSILQRDVQELSHIEGLTALPDLLTLLASRTGGLLNTAELSRSLELPNTTLKRYLTLLEAIFLVVTLPPWSTNIGKQLVKSPKLFLNDSGLLCYLLGCDAQALANDRTQLGSVFENFVVMELMKQITWSQTRPKMFHFRTTKGYEIDILLQSRSGKLVGIECKSSATVTADNFKSLELLKEKTGKKFHRGIVLYTGTDTVSFGENLEAIPVSALWEVFNQKSPKLTEKNLDSSAIHSLRHLTVSRRAKKQ